MHRQASTNAYSPETAATAPVCTQLAGIAQEQDDEIRVARERQGEIGHPGIGFGEFWVGASIPKSLEVEHSFISSIECQLLGRSDHLPYVVAPVQKLTLDQRNEGVLLLQKCRVTSITHA